MLNFIMRSFALSFSIFIRAVPMWAFLGALLYVGLMMLWDHPIVFILLLLLGMGTTTFFMMFSQIRSGLSVLGETTPPDIGKLLKKSVRFCFFVGLWSTLVTLLSVAGFFTLGYLGLFDWDRMFELALAGTPEAQSELESVFSGAGVYAYYVISSTLTQIAYCAIAVPMAANAASCSAKARDYEIFWGFGAYAFRMFLLNLIAGTILTVGLILYFVLGITMAASTFSGLDEASILEAFQQAPGWREMLTLGALIALPVLALIWWGALWCAGATIAFVDRRNVSEAKFQQELECIYEEPMAREDLRALRMARMAGSMPAAG